MSSEFVLICDADPLLTELLEHRLGQQGYETAVARDGGEALTLLAERPPDAVIMESMLPVNDGYEVLRRIRENDQIQGPAGNHVERAQTRSRHCRSARTRRKRLYDQAIHP